MVSARRYLRVMEVLSQRQPDLTVILDGVHKPHNLSAIVRTCDAVGVLDVHAVPRAGVSLPVMNSTAQGSGNWVNVHRHRSFADAHARVREQGCVTLAAHLSEAAVDYRSVDLTRPTAIVMGTEKFGLDDETAAVVDQHIIIGMHGMVESLNVSVAAALILFEAERQRKAAGLYENARLEPARVETTRFEWLYPKLARFCRDTGQDYPQLSDEGEVIGRVRGMPEPS